MILFFYIESDLQSHDKVSIARLHGRAGFLPSVLPAFLPSVLVGVLGFGVTNGSIVFSTKRSILIQGKRVEETGSGWVLRQGWGGGLGCVG